MITENDWLDIFKAYDIRGSVGDQLTPELVHKIGRALADYLPAQGVIAVGYDMRPDSQGLAQALRDGLTTQGRDVIDIGQVTSDMAYFAVGKLELAGAAMVTASHNPGKDNGIKIYRDGVRPVGLDSGLAEIRDAVSAGQFAPAAHQPGAVRPANITELWIEHCLRFVTTPLKPFRVAIDAGNGMAGAILPYLEPNLPIKVKRLYYELDGTFPNHEPNPSKPENLAALIATIKAEGLDFGIAFDGDGDRAVFVDDLGRPVSGSVILALVAKHYLARYPGAEIIHDVRTSRATRELIKEWGGRPFRTKAGRVKIAEVMRERHAPFGGETTGHLFFVENYCADSGLITALVTMVALTESGDRLSTLVDRYHKYPMEPEQNFRVRDAKAILERLAVRYHDAEYHDWLDGLTIEYPDWWFNLRTSNTEPLVRLNIEAHNDSLLKEKTTEVLGMIKESQ